MNFRLWKQRRPLAIIGVTAILSGLFSMSSAYAAMGDGTQENIKATNLDPSPPSASGSCGPDLDGDSSADGVKIRFSNSGGPNMGKVANSQSNTGYVLTYDEQKFDVDGVTDSADPFRVRIASITKDGITLPMFEITQYFGGSENDRLRFVFNPAILTTQEDWLLAQRPDDTYAAGQATQFTICTLPTTPKVSITKTATPTSVPETGGDVAYTIVVANIGGPTLTLDTLTDDIFGNLDGQGTCDVPQTVPVLGNYTCTFTKALSGDAPGTHTNVATVNATGNGQQASDTDDAIVTFTDVLPSIAVTKSADPTSMQEPGGNATFTIVVTNNATEAATLNTLTDSIFGDLDGKGTCDVPRALAPNGGAYSCTFTASVTGTVAAPHHNVVTATATDNDGNPASATDDTTIEFTDAKPEIILAKQAQPETVSETGGSVTYLVFVDNKSVEPVTLTTLVDDKFGNLDGAGTCKLPVVMPVGGSYSCTFTKTMSGPAGSTHTNVVTGTAYDGDQDEAKASDDAVVTFTDNKPVIEMVKTASPTVVKEPGENVTFTFTVNNKTAEEVSLTSLMDSVFGDLNGQGSCVTPQAIAANGSYTCTVTKLISGNGGSAHTNVVTATATDDDRNETKAEDDAKVEISDVIPNIIVAKHAQPETVSETGGNVTYLVFVDNKSAEPVTLTALVDDKFGDLDGVGTCNVPVVIAANGAFSCTFVKHVAGNAGGTHTNVVTATAVDDEKNEAKDADDAVVTFTDVLPEIELQKQAQPETVPETGGDVTYLVFVDNKSDEAVTLTSLIDDKFGNLDGKGTCELPVVIAPRTGYSCKFEAHVAGNAGTTHTNVVVGTASDDDKNTTSDRDDAVVTFTDVLPAIHVVKTANPDTIPETGGLVSYSFTVFNDSQEPVSLTSLVDDKFGDLDGAGTCNLPVMIAAGGSYSCVVVINFVRGDFGATHTNTATAVAYDDEKNPARGSDSADVQFADITPWITVEKTANPTSVPETGGNVTYSVSITNGVNELLLVTSLTDDQFGNIGLTETDCPVPAFLPPLATITCSFTKHVAGDASGPAHKNIVTAKAIDDELHEVADDDDAVVAFTDVLPTITVDKDDRDVVIVEPGGAIEYDVTVTNTSAEAVKITKLEDRLLNLDMDLDITKVEGYVLETNCGSLIGQVLAAGESAKCSFLIPIWGNAGYTKVNRIIATAIDNEKNEAVASDIEKTPIVDAKPAIGVEKTDKGATFNEGGSKVLYYVTVRNDSVEPVIIERIADILNDDYSNWIDVTKVDGPVVYTTCDALIGASMEPGETRECQFGMFLTGKPGEVFTDIVKVFAYDDEKNLAFGWADEDTPVVDVRPTITVDKDDAGASVVEPGGDVAYTVTITNTSAEPVWILSIEDQVNGANLNVAALNGGVVTTECAALIGQRIEPGKSVSCKFTLAVKGAGGTQASDTVTVTVKDDELTTAQASDTEKTPILAAPKPAETPAPPAPQPEPTPEPATPEAGAPIENETEVLGSAVSAGGIAAAESLARTGQNSTKTARAGVLLVMVGMLSVSMEFLLRRRRQGEV